MRGWLLCGVLLVLLGCGQRGELYLPEPAPAVEEQSAEDDG